MKNNNEVDCIVAFIIKSRFFHGEEYYLKSKDKILHKANLLEELEPRDYMLLFISLLFIPVIIGVIVIPLALIYHNSQLLINYSCLYGVWVLLDIAFCLFINREKQPYKRIVIDFGVLFYYVGFMLAFLSSSCQQVVTFCNLTLYTGSLYCATCVLTIPYIRNNLRKNKYLEPTYHEWWFKEMSTKNNVLSKEHIITWAVFFALLRLAPQVLILGLASLSVPLAYETVKCVMRYYYAKKYNLAEKLLEPAENIK